MAIDIADLPTKNGDFPVRYVCLPEGKTWLKNSPYMAQNKKTVEKLGR